MRTKIIEIDTKITEVRHLDQSQHMTLARLMPAQPMAVAPSGLRDLDLALQPIAASPQYPPRPLLLSKSLAFAKQNAPFVGHSYFSAACYLIQKQKRIVKLVETLLELLKNLYMAPPERVLIRRKAGTGQGMVIDAMTARIHKKLGPYGLNLSHPLALH